MCKRIWRSILTGGGQDYVRRNSINYPHIFQCFREILRVYIHIYNFTRTCELYAAEVDYVIVPRFDTKTREKIERSGKNYLSR